MKNLIIYLSIIGFVLFGATAHAACPDEIPSLGKYRNYSFGFSILIPQGLKGFWNSAACIQEADGSCLCMSDHGRIIPLKNDNTIEIYAGHAIEENESLGELVHREFEGLKKKADGGEFVVLSLKEAKLHHNNALIYCAKYEHDGITRIREAMLSQSNNKSKEFIIDLDTDVASFKKNHKIFKQIVRSWLPTKYSEY